MGRKPAETVRTLKIPKHITEIGMTPSRYFDLKVHIKSIVRPGTPGFEVKRFGNKESEKVYRQWLDDALVQLGPKFFPEGGKGLVWPEDYDGIYKAVHRVVRSLSYKIRKSSGKEMEGACAAEGEAGNDEIEVEMSKDGENYEGGPVPATDVGEDVLMIDEEVGQEQNQEKEIMVIGGHDQGKEVTEEEMAAAAIELEDLLDLMKPEVFAQLPDLTDEDFDWDEVADAQFLELVAGGLSR